MDKGRQSLAILIDADAESIISWLFNSCCSGFTLYRCIVVTDMKRARVDKLMTKDEIEASIVFLWNSSASAEDDVDDNGEKNL